MANFTPVPALIGGALIGLSAVLLMMFNGRIAGISGVFSGSLFADGTERTWRLAFLLGLIAGPVAYQIIFRATPPFELTAGWPLIIIGGLLVGFGTRLGSGCTSGHGVCGLSRLSPRAFAAVGMFMAAGMLTATLVRVLMEG